jgi:hypothetical protein
MLPVTFQPPRFREPAFRRHWKAPRNAKGGFRSYEEMKMELAARAAAYYGPPQGPCGQFRDKGSSFVPVCFCGWNKGAHQNGGAA